MYRWGEWPLGLHERQGRSWLGTLSKSRNATHHETKRVSSFACFLGSLREDVADPRIQFFSRTSDKNKPTRHTSQRESQQTNEQNQTRPNQTNLNQTNPNPNKQRSNRPTKTKNRPTDDLGYRGGAAALLSLPSVGHCRHWLCTLLKNGAQKRTSRT